MNDTAKAWVISVALFCGLATDVVVIVGAWHVVFNQGESAWWWVMAFAMSGGAGITMYKIINSITTDRPIKNMGDF